MLRLPNLATLAAIGVLAVTPACDDGNDDATTTDASASTGMTTGVTAGETDAPTTATTADDPTGATTIDDPTADPTDATTSTDPTSDPTTDPTTDPTDATTGAGDSSTGDVPTTGPGVLPGETGQEAMCRRAMECGSTYFADAQECVDAGSDYWGDCVEAVAALDAFGACMSDMACEDYNPDAYNPNNTPCADLYGELQQAGPC